MRRRWIAYLVLGAALGLALWPQSRVMAAAVLVVLTVLAVELRAVRRAQRELAGRHRDLALAAAQLALASLRSAGPHDAGGATVPALLVPLAVAALVERGEVLDALALWRTQAPMAEVDIWTRRRLWRGLQARGYLREALAVADSCLTEHRDRRTRAVRDRLAAEILVLSGQARPSVRDAPPVGFTPVPGRVLHLVGASVPVTEAGYTVRTHYTALAQRDAGLDPHVVTQMGYGTDRFRATRDVVDGIPYHRVPGASRGTVPLDRWLDGHVQRVARLVAKLRPAALHAASDYVNALTARAVGDAFGLPVVYESRGFWEETWLSRLAQTYAWNLADLAGTHGLPDVYTLRRALEDRCRREADWVITLAEVMAERIACGGVARDRISVVPNGVDVDAFPVQTRNQALAEGLGIANGVTVIGYVSSIVEYEGIDVLIAAYAKVKAAGAGPVRLLIVGDGPELDPLLRQASDLGLDDAIFTGRVPHNEVLGYYSLIDIFVVPRKPVEVCHLVTPLKPFEALATGRTLVLSNVRALAAIAADSGAAALFEAGNPDALAATLTDLLGDEARRHRLAQIGAEWVRSHRTWSANGAAYLDVYRALGALTSPSAEH